MNFFKILILFFSINIFIANDCFKDLSNEVLLECIKSSKFTKFYKICEKKEDTIFIYTNLDYFKDIKPIKICNNKKTLQILKIDKKIDLNNSNDKMEEKIFIYRFEKSKTCKKVYFINTHNNSLSFKLNKRNKIISYNSGAF